MSNQALHNLILIRNLRKCKTSSFPPHITKKISNQVLDEKVDNENIVQNLYSNWQKF